MNVKELINFSKAYLKSHSVDDEVIVSKVLFEYVFNISKNKIMIEQERELEKEKIEIFKKYLNKIAEGEPLQYITNKQEFMGLNFYVDQSVLIPQPDTEILVQEVIDLFKDKSCKILDLCTGSGAIAISLAKYIDNSLVVATDISQKAIQVAKLNAEKNLVHKKMKFIVSDMFENIEDTDFDIIVSNPPYIKKDVIKKLAIQVQREPLLALDGGEDGLDFYKIIAKNAKKHLKDSGKIILEIGYDQKDEVSNLLIKSNYKSVNCKKDLAGNDRIITATKGEDDEN